HAYTYIYTSMSSSHHEWIYEVFINFRGEDVRNNFVPHLYAGLSNAGIHTFIDYKLHKGTELGPELMRAIEGSRIALVVFSRTYAKSRWCLNELVKIMECHTNYGQVVEPIFYDVDPSDVRNQKGAFGKSLEELVRNTYSGIEMLDAWGKWKRALSEAADLVGWDIRNCRNEDEQVRDILKDVSEKLGHTFLSVAKFPVGLQSRKEEVIEFIENQLTEGCVVGIWGMGGLGKTTTAKAIYNQIYRRFMNRSFIENIRENCKTADKGYAYLQGKLLSDVLKTKVEIHNVAMGITMIEERLCGSRTLIVLDDVDDFDQLNFLCGNLEWIGSGSVLIVTTRNIRMLDFLKANRVFEMKEMDENESLELFSWHAFREAKPTKEFTELSINMVSYCGGLPLALEVLGSHLFKRKEEQWNRVLSKLKERTPQKKVQDILRISYDGLQSYMEREIFLDICCFFIGKERTYVTKILNGCGLHADDGIATLIEMSLIKVENENKLAIHDLLRDMGIEIIRQSSPKEPEKRSRLCILEDVVDVLTEHNGTKEIEGLALKLQTSTICFNTKAFENMKRLRLLQLDHVQLYGDYKYLNKKLRWVCWQGFPSEYIPIDLYQGNAVAIDLKRNNLKLVWKEPQLLERLKFLNLSHSNNLKSTPDFSKLPSLEKLILKDCPNLCMVHQSIGDLRNLVLLNLKDCIRLNNLPKSIYKLQSIKTLIISGCSKIDRLEEEIVQMGSLTTLYADNTAIKQVPSLIVKSKSIGYISICGYKGLSRNVFPSIIWSWMSPTINPLSQIHPLWAMSSSLVSMDVQASNLNGLAPTLCIPSKLRSVLVQCDMEIQLSKELRTIMNDIYGANFIEGVASTSQIPEHSLRCNLIAMGSCGEVFNILKKSTLKGLTTTESLDAFLPGDNYPYWSTHTREGHSVPFRVPGGSNCCMKGITLCVVYSSPPEITADESLVCVLMVNYSKQTIQVCKRDTITSFNNEDWQGLTSNLGPGDNVEIFAVFRPGLTVMKTAIYLIYDQPIAVKIEPSSTVILQRSPNGRMELSTNVTMDPSPEVNEQPSPHMENSSSKPKKKIHTRLRKRMGKCLCLNRDVIHESE
ncbi:TMV resistance protein N-like, partial [Abrus precatorius]|uniref:TMV resistance protein N-like n=1 Tax=Abrus precatorius TaxID=3816 RepID=A0A8B8K0B6_ABRPR